VGGCLPHETLKGDGCQPLLPRHEWDPKRWQTLSPREWATGGPGGRSPHGGRLWGVSPHKFKRGGELPALATPPRVGSKTLVNPKPTGVGNRGSRGAKLPWREVVGGVPPQIQKRGRAAHISNPPRVGPKTLVNPKPTGVGKGGPGGKAPWRGAVGGVPPQIQKRGRAAHISNPATSGTQNAGKPSANGGGQLASLQELKAWPRGRKSFAKFINPCYP